MLILAGLLAAPAFATEGIVLNDAEPLIDTRAMDEINEIILQCDNIANNFAMHINRVTGAIYSGKKELLPSWRAHINPDSIIVETTTGKMVVLLSTLRYQLFSKTDKPKSIGSCSIVQ
jgi:hypothetical protein